MERPARPAARGPAPPPSPWALLLALLALPLARAVEAEDSYVQRTFFQDTSPTQKEAGEFLFAFDGEEILHVDWDQKRALWRLPDFQRFTGAETEAALGDLAVIRNSLLILMKRSNRTRAQNVAPSATVYPRKPVELGDPNVLICFVDKFSPPVLNVTWLKNGEVVSQGVQETGFLFSVDYTFRKFSYLPFVPAEGDVYACKVDHWGLRESLTHLWYSKEPTLVSETPEDVLCGLGLALGLVGLVVGTIFSFKAVRMNQNRHGRRDGL